MFKKNRINEEYCDSLKMEAIRQYILDANNEFDYADLAEHMGMTFKQLQNYLIMMKQLGELYVESGMLCVNQDKSSLIFKEKMQNLEEYAIIQDARKYIPPGFQKKFNGYT